MQIQNGFHIHALRTKNNKVIFDILILFEKKKKIKKFSSWTPPHEKGGPFFFIRKTVHIYIYIYISEKLFKSLFIQYI